jgi:hypothetical protein
MQSMRREFVAADGRKHGGRQAALVLGQQREHARHPSDPRRHIGQQLGRGSGAQLVQVLSTTAQAKGCERVEVARWLAIAVDARVGRRVVAHGVRPPDGGAALAKTNEPEY